MAFLPVLSGREIVRAFSQDGWQMVRQKGSHMILVKSGHMATLSVPDHKERGAWHSSQPDPFQWPDSGTVY